MYHGEKVAFGTLTQLILENVNRDELEEVIDFCLELDLPVTPQSVYDAILATDAMDHYYKEEK